jgi:hypothetical protein
MVYLAGLQLKFIFNSLGENQLLLISAAVDCHYIGMVIVRFTVPRQAIIRLM